MGTASNEGSSGAVDAEVQPPEEIVRWAVERYSHRLVLACSFQKESAVLVDMLLSADPAARIASIDTHLLFPETHVVWRAVEERYGVEIERLEGPSLVRQAVEHGAKLWERDPARCCAMRKVEPLRERLRSADAWISGLRREQSATRASASQVAWDDRHGLVKINPLVAWSDADVWRYVLDRRLPYNELHDRGYESIGCEPCTRPGRGRAGRWPGAEQSECGIHGGVTP